MCDVDSDTMADVMSGKIFQAVFSLHATMIGCRLVCHAFDCRRGEPWIRCTWPCYSLGAYTDKCEDDNARGYIFRLYREVGLILVNPRRKSLY